MQHKERLKLKIESVAYGGEGVGRIDNFVIFVPFSAAGDVLEIEIAECKKNFARGKILKIIESSAERVAPLCRYYMICGGCCYQHLSYAEQLAQKKNQVADAFRKIGKITNPPVAEVVSSPAVYHYRGKAQFHEESDCGGEIGFLDISGGRLVDIERCEIMEETINDQMRDLRKKESSINGIENRRTIWAYPQPDQVDKGIIRRIVRGKEFLVPDDGFFQANLFLTDQLVEEVIRLVSTGKSNTIVDAYCGCGLFSIFLAGYAQNVIGIEENKKSVKYARINAEKENIKNAEFINGDVAEVLRGEFLLAKRHADLIVLDPPRTGCSMETLQAISIIQPQKIIYISCNPATQARDVKYLSEKGYELNYLLPLDMFPQTKHIETMGLLTLKPDNFQKPRN